MKIVNSVVRWIHLLSFDAVLVGLVWQSIFFSLNHTGPETHERIILAVAIWLAYVADRLIDCSRIEINQPSTERHKLYRRHWKAFLIPWCLLFTFIVAYSFQRLSKEAFVSGLGLVVLINLYYLFIRVARRFHLLGASKEILTATIFTVGVSFFYIQHAEPGVRELYAPQIAFGLLCLINLLNISFRDKHTSTSQNEKTLPHFTRNHLAVTCLLLTISAGLAIYLIQHNFREFAMPYTIAWVCTLAYLLLSQTQNVDTGRYWADMPLMLPVIALVV